MNKENGIETAVATRTGRTVFWSRNRNAAGRINEGMTRTSRSGMRGIIDGLVFTGTSFGGYLSVVADIKSESTYICRTPDE